MNPEKILYREANRNDVPFMKEMLVECCFASGVTSISVDNLHEYPDTEINIEGWNIETEPGIIAERESGRPVGAVWLRNLPELGHSVNEYLPEITIAVSAPYRGKGIAANLISDNNLSLMDFVIQKYGNMTASELVSIVLAKNTLWYKIAKENNLLKDFTGHKKTYSDFKIDLSQYLTGCDSEFYNEQKDLNDIARTLKL